MISSIDAKSLIEVGTHPLKTIFISLEDSVGYALAEDLYAPIDFPNFDQSAMDGYGICLEASNILDKYHVTGEEQTGSIDLTPTIQAGEAVRIFTGAKIPFGVNTVIQQEWVEKSGNDIKIMPDVEIKNGMNIRPKGSQTKKGDFVLKKGTAIHPATASLIAGLGIDKINVFKKPEIIILNTGKELVKPGLSIQRGQIYESNSFALNQALLELHILPKEIAWVDDNKNELIEKMNNAIHSCNLLLITGGVSVGDYDYVIEALEANGVQQSFHKIKQKPGKPLYFGSIDHTIVFGLPGNPASVMTCFYQYVYPCIKKMMGFNQTTLRQLTVPCLNQYEKKAGFTHFLIGKIHTHGVEILNHQESYKMNAYAIADAFVEVEEDCTSIQKNDLVKVYLLLR
jgi:molybdopterin molybdotransferase